MNKIFLSALTIIALTGCADRYSLDKNRGPDPSGITTHNQLSLPPDFLLRAPEPTSAPAAEAAAETAVPAEQPAAVSLSDTVEIQQNESTEIPAVQEPAEETIPLENISEFNETIVEAPKTDNNSAAGETVTEITETVEEE